MPQSVVQVLLPLAQTKCVFDYFCSKQLPLGSLVQVHFKNKKSYGIVWAHQASSGHQIYAHKMKTITRACNAVCFSKLQLAFIKFVAWYNLMPLGGALKLFLPFQNFDFLEKEVVSNAAQQQNQLKLVQLNGEQERALKILQASASKPILLEGVTGSGKTEVYLRLVEEVLCQGDSQVLVLLPEVRSYSNSHAWHSNVSNKEKERLWKMIATGHAKLIIGARSALFLPFKNLKLIVVDEEHDSSYKQEERGVYNARDMAVAYGHIAKIPVVLSTATPSVETAYNAFKRKYAKAELTSRYQEAALPETVIVNMKKEPLKQSRWLSESLIRATDHALNKGKQVMFFLNRKGYAPITLCKICGYKVGCRNCSTALVMYKTTEELLCHHCGYQLRNLIACPNCTATNSLIHCGPGVDRLLEDASKIWPEKRVVAITKDSIQGKQAELLASILEGAVDIIIGTQVMSKGYHFPNLILVGVIDADIGFFGTDLKASERTFQLLTQVSGRAGRESPGKVFIQTYAPENSLLHAMQANDKQKFYTEELAARQMMDMPPFSRLVALIFSGRTHSKLLDIVKGFVGQMPYVKGIEVLGPVQAPLAKIRNHYRYRLLIKAKANINVQNYIKQTLEKYKLPASIRVKVDVDPYNFL
jgi:primosomal protein N' (replication factor Y)